MMKRLGFLALGVATAFAIIAYASSKFPHGGVIYAWRQPLTWISVLVPFALLPFLGVKSWRAMIITALLIIWGWSWIVDDSEVIGANIGPGLVSIFWPICVLAAVYVIELGIVPVIRTLGVRKRTASGSRED